MRILDRYIFREVGVTWLGVTLVLLFILVTNQFARVLGRAAAGEAPKDAVFMLLGLTSVQYVSVLIPVALLLAIMLTLGRLNRDSEMTAMIACGIGAARLYRPLAVFALLLAGLLGWLTMDIVPWSFVAAKRIEAQAEQFMDSGILEPGRFHTDSDDDVVFYAERVSEEGLLENLFLQRRVDNKLEVAVARRGRITEDDNNGISSVVLFDGERIEGQPGTVDFQIVRFGEHGIPIRQRAVEVSLERPRMMPTAALWGSSDLRRRAELQWRLSAPFMVVVLTLLAVPLSRAKPREGRYGRLVIGIMVYILYSNLVEATRSWVERGQLPSELGIWWVHFAMMAVALGLLYLQNGSRHHLMRPREVKERNEEASDAAD